MKKRGFRFGQLTAGTALLCALSATTALPAFANIKSLEINADTDNVDGYTAGQAFLPKLTLEDEDEDMLTLSADTAELRDANPTVPYTVKFTLHADDDVLDDDLRIRGTGIRQTYVDYVSVDNTEAAGRLLIYPFYQLTAPEGLTADYAAKKLRWQAVQYAGDYEVVLTYTQKSGSQKTVHRHTKNTELNISDVLSLSSSGTVSASVRALPTEEAGYVKAEVKDGTASWEPFSSAEQYKLKIQWTDAQGRSHKQEETVTGTSKNVSAYVNSSDKKEVTVTVRAIPKQNDAKYYNIAVSEWASAGDGAADTSDYDTDDVWEMLADYQAVVDGNFAAASNAYTGLSGSTPDAGGGTWQRSGWRWKYLLNGTACNQGWKQIGSSWYYFDADGYMHTGWLQDGGKWYYLESRVGSSCGVMVTGSREINGKSYSFGSDGSCMNP